jgi:hypothetical protein
LRFSRDKRGYENTFVVHTERRRGKARSRILYWFRTPPGVKVGRSALDESAIREIEEHNPDVEFDWTKILKGQGGPEAKPPSQERRSVPRPSPETAPENEQRSEEEAEATVAEAEPVATDVDTTSPAEAGPDPLAAVEVAAARDEAPAAERRLGAEGVLRLRARYAEILARISERAADLAQQDQLRSEAERLNPDTWVTEDEVRDGLERYEAVFESLRAVVGHWRRQRTEAVEPPPDPGDEKTGEEQTGEGEKRDQQE